MEGRKEAVISRLLIPMAQEFKRISFPAPFLGREAREAAAFFLRI